MSVNCGPIGPPPDSVKLQAELELAKTRIAALTEELENVLRAGDLSHRSAEALRQVLSASDAEMASWLEQRVEVATSRLKQQFKPYMQHLGCCCRGLPSALRPCNCGAFELLGPISESELEKRKEHPEFGPFPNLVEIEEWVKRYD